MPQKQETPQRLQGDEGRWQQRSRGWRRRSSSLKLLFYEKKSKFSGQTFRVLIPKASSLLQSSCIQSHTEIERQEIRSMKVLFRKKKKTEEDDDDDDVEPGALFSLHLLLKPLCLCVSMTSSWDYCSFPLLSLWFDSSFSSIAFPSKRDKKEKRPSPWKDFIRKEWRGNKKESGFLHFIRAKPWFKAFYTLMESLLLHVTSSRSFLLFNVKVCVSKREVPLLSSSTKKRVLCFITKDTFTVKKLSFLASSFFYQISLIMMLSFLREDCVICVLDSLSK